MSERSAELELELELKLRWDLDLDLAWRCCASWRRNCCLIYLISVKSRERWYPLQEITSELQSGLKPVEK
jgi:hypothetical protein